MRVLLVEDESYIADPLAKVLEKSSIPTDVVYDGYSGYLLALKDVYSVILLDIMLPEMNGLDVLKKIRSEGINTPVILLTAKDDVQDKVKGLEYGADDYVTKPFSSLELIARIKAISRRGSNQIATEEASIGDMVFYKSEAKVVISGVSVELTSKEVNLMDLFISNPKTVISKQRLLDTVWGIESEATENTVEIYMHHLRKKLAISKNVKISTIRNLGYVMNVEDGDDR